ncbi:hypothetical protein LINPERPRIM_LOCUS37043, partial [Linum perenne]
MTTCSIQLFPLLMVFGTAAVGGSSTSGSVSSTMPHRHEYVQQPESRVSQLVSIVRSLAPQQFVGSASSAAIPPQTQAYQQSYQQSNR